MGKGSPPPDEFQMLSYDLHMLRGENQNLRGQLDNLTRENARLKVEPPAAGVAALAVRGAHNPAWSEHSAPDGSRYYFNKDTQESVWDRPLDFNPQATRQAGGTVQKGPSGANLFVVRKLRRGEYDQFTDQDLREAFTKYGDVLRCELAVDPESGWSKGYGFVSYTSAEMADIAIENMNGSWLAGKQMKVEKTKEDYGK